MEIKKREIFTWRVLWLIILASVLNVLMWLTFNQEYRTDLLSNGRYLASMEFVTDFAITFFESAFLIIIGFFSGKFLLKYMERIGKNGLPLIITAMYLILYLLSICVSYIYYGILGYYDYQEFSISAMILGTLSSLFAMIMLSDNMIDVARKIIASRKDAEDKTQKTKRKLAIMELERNNVIADNHFLLNCMGMVYGEIEENPKEASKTMENLLNVTRYMSANSSVPVVSLHEEMEFLDWYLGLIYRRHPYVHVDITGIGPETNGYVVPMSVQGLILNAIKHNAHDSCNPLTIQVSLKYSRITVSNRIQPPVSLPQTTGLGLKLLKDRYRDLTDEPVIVDRKGNEFIVSIPLLYDGNMKTDTYESDDNRG